MRRIPIVKDRGVYSRNEGENRKDVSTLVVEFTFLRQMLFTISTVFIICSLFLVLPVMK